MVPSSPPVDAQRFAEEGYVHLPGFFAPDALDHLLRTLRTVGRARAGLSGLDEGGMTFHSLLFPLDTELQSFIADQRLIDALRPLLGDDLWVRWDQAVAKAPGAPTFPWHQDNAYSLLLDPHVQAWIALTDAGPDDGGLWLAPGSHRRPRGHHWTGGHVEVDEPPGEEVPLEARRGDLVLFSSRLLHRTTPNRADAERWVYVIEYMSARHHDPFVEPPYFQVARHGRSRPRWRRWPRARRSVRNQVRYLPRRLAVRRREGRWRRGL